MSWKTIAKVGVSETTHELIITSNVSILTVLDHPKEISKFRKLDKWVPHDLIEHQMTRRLGIYCTVLLRQTGKPCLYRTGMCDEKWILFNISKYAARWLNSEKVTKHNLKTNLNKKKKRSHLCLFCGSALVSSITAS